MLRREFLESDLSTFHTRYLPNPNVLTLAVNFTPTVPASFGTEKSEIGNSCYTWTGTSMAGVYVRLWLVHYYSGR